MTTQLEMEMAYVAQAEVIATLYEIADPDPAARLERRMTARQQRHYGDGWPYSCRSLACFWCRKAMIRGRWYGMREWSQQLLRVLPSSTLLDGFGVGCATLGTGQHGAGDDGAGVLHRHNEWRLQGS